VGARACQQWCQEGPAGDVSKGRKSLSLGRELWMPAEALIKRRKEPKGAVISDKHES
jgi:hypothetical protein